MFDSVIDIASTSGRWLHKASVSEVTVQIQRISLEPGSPPLCAHLNVKI